MRYIMSYGVALALILLVAGWLVSGTLIRGGQGPGEGETAFIDVIEPEGGPLRGLLEAVGLVEPKDEAEDTQVAEAEEAEADEPALRNVRAMTYLAEEMPIEVVLRGRTQASSTVTVRTETNGILKELHVTKGDRVSAGDLVCSLDRGTRAAGVAQAEAAVAQAVAALDQARADLETNQRLRERGLSPENSARQLEVAVSSAESNLKAAQASLDEAEAELDRTVIHAEIAGVVQEPIANVGDMLNAGETCATVVQLDPMHFVGSVTEARVGQLDTGMPAHIRTVNGDEAEGVVRYISATADSATRTFEVEIAFDNPEAALRSGITARATVDVDSVGAHFIAQSDLTLDADGTLGVRVVENGTVEFRPVEIIRDETDGVWVGGLPETVDVITLGQEYVLEGEPVRVSYVEEGLSS